VDSVGSTYVLPAAFDFAALGVRLQPRFALGEPAVQSGDRTFYDTFDGRLRAKRLELVHAAGRLSLSGAAERELAGADWPQASDRIALEDLPEGRLRAILSPVCELRALLPGVTVRSDRRTLPVLDGREKTVARLVAEQAAVAGLDGRGALRARLHVLGVRGYDKARTQITRTLAGLGLTAATQSLRDEAIATAGGSPYVLAVEPVVELTIDMPADLAAAVLLAHQVDVIEANLDGTLADLDTEFLHDLRVAVRRTRSLQRELKTVFPPEQLAQFRAEFRWLQEITGPSRDLDVYLLDFEDFAGLLLEQQRPDLEPLRALLAERRVAERERMERALTSERTGAIITAWRELLARLPDMPVDERADAAMPIAELAARRIARVYRQMTRMGAAIDDASPATELHELRKKGKELRYLLEFFAPLFSAKVTKPMVRTLKGLQDTLGRFQDRDVQAAMMRTLAAELAGRDHDGRVLMALGVLAERLDEQQAAARTEFAERFAAFGSSRQRKLVGETFG
jgi:CHAD domain-containing protein